MKKTSYKQQGCKNKTIREHKNKKRINSIIKILEKNTDKKFNNLSILEYGCSTGFAIKELAIMGNKCTGVDINEEKLNFARDHAREIKNIEYINIDKALPFADKHFDFVFSSEVIEHVPVKDRNFYISEFRRVMKDDGVGYISYPNFWFPLETHYYIPFHHWLQRIYHRNNLIYEDIPTKKEIREELNKYFTIKDISCVFLNSDYVKDSYSKIKIIVARMLCKTIFAIQDYLMLIPGG